MLGALDQMYASYELSYPDQPETDSNLSIYEASTSKVSWNVFTIIITNIHFNVIYRFSSISRSTRAIFKFQKLRSL